MIIDSPPFGAVSDSNVLGVMVDGVLLVVREKKSRKAALRSAIVQLEDCGVRILGTVLNAIKTRGGRFGYRNAYAYHRHDYYLQYSADQQTDDERTESTRSG